MQGEISNNPIESGKIPRQLFRVILINVLLGIELYVLCEVHDQTEILKCVFVDGSDRVVDEDAGGKYGEGKYFDVVVLVLVERADSLGIYDENVDFVAIGAGAFEGSSPAPEPLGAGVDGGTDSKPVVAIEQDAVEQVGLAGAVETGHGDN